MDSPGDCDVIEKLLRSTGLSCDDLLVKLQQYKANKSTENTAISDSEDGFNLKNIANNDNSVILKTQSSVGDKICEANKKDEFENNTSNGADEEIDGDKCEEWGDSLERKQEITEEKIVSDEVKNDEDMSICTKVEGVCEDTENEDILKSIEEFTSKAENFKDSLLVQNDEDVPVCTKADDICVSTENADVSNCIEEKFASKAENFDCSSNLSKEEIAVTTECLVLCEDSESGPRFLEGDDEIVGEDDRDSAKNESSLTDSATKIIDENKSIETEAYHDESVIEANKDEQTKGDVSTTDDTTEFTSNFQTCPSVTTDHNYSNPKCNFDSSEQEMSSSSADDVNKSSDDLSNIIRKQLSSLRNMKKSTGYLPDLQNKRSMFFHNLKKKRKSCDLSSLTQLNIEDEKNEAPDESNQIGKEDDNSLISLTDETQFVILDVTGGVDRVTSEQKRAKQTANEERRFAVISDTTEKTANPELNKSNSLGQDKGKNVKSPAKEIKNILTNYRRKMSLNYFDENCYNFTPKTEEKKLETVTVKKNISENFNEDPGVNKSVKNSEKSPFVSDSLEDFLSESAQLKISYSIPKLGAEEGISESTKKSPFDDRVGRTLMKTDLTNDQETPQKEKTKLIKAKTLAEMRRQFEKMKSKNKASSKAKEENLSKEDNSTITRNVVPESFGFVTYNRKKLWVPSKIKNKCICTINHKPRRVINKEVLQDKPQFFPNTNRKPSLLSTLTQSKPNMVKYKPGPLCKKAELQTEESRDKWTTEVKTLPKVFLEVQPEIGKPIDFKVAHLIPYFDDVVISEERTNFALSVLKTKNQNTETNPFKFHVPYVNKQEKMVVRKRYKPVYKVNSNSSNDINEIKNVLDDIIKYVEIKEIADSLIKEDETIVEELKNQVTDNKTKTKNRKLKKNKLNIELQRLSCKVIDVATKDDEDQEECTKLHCKMGCVCKSLLCESAFSDHCQLVECMFGCKCPPIPANEVVTTNNTLSAHTVNHLDGKAKKNLAKVEREFTQTIIHTDNDVILVGTGGRDKMKRTSKTPKKYTDFIDNIDEFLSESRCDPQGNQKTELKSCSINLTKLDLDDVIPYCLYHNMYNCTCKGQMIDSSVNIRNKPGSQFRIFKDKFVNKTWYNSCARIRKIFPQYKMRNRHPKYKEKLRTQNGYPIVANRNENESVETCSNVNVTKLDTEVKKTNKRKQTYGYPLVATRDESESVETSSNINVKKFDTEVKKTNKRKQSFELREDVIIKTDPAVVDNSVKNSTEKEYALQRRKKKIKTNGVSVDIKNVPLPYFPVFDGEIKVSLKDNQDMLQIIGEENSNLEYLRILPWTKLVENFHQHRINIWAREKRNSALLCNTVGYFPPKSFIDIRKVHQKSHIINWILTGNLPPDRPRNLMHLILTPKNAHFLISGYCLKKVDYDKDTGKVITENSGKTEVKVMKSIANPGRSRIGRDFEHVSTDSASSLEETYATSIDPLEIHPNDSLEVMEDESLNSTESLINSGKQVQLVSVPEVSSALPTLKTIKRFVSIDPLQVQCRPQNERGQNPQASKDDAKLSIDPLEFCKVVESTETSKEVPILTIPESPESRIGLKRIRTDTDKESPSKRLKLKETAGLQKIPKSLRIGPGIKQTKENSSQKKSIETSKLGEGDSVSVVETSLKQASTNSAQIKTNSSQQIAIPSRSLKCSHKDMYNKSKTLVLTNKEFPRRKLYLSVTHSSKGFEMSKIIYAPLPKVAKKFRWRMIYLNSDFSFLSFVRPNYSIKYTDLMDVAKMSNNIKSTITLRNKEFCEYYKHPIFGIFCVPDYQDRLFIGPYAPLEKHNIETLRYLQGRLIDTHIFNKMVGKKTDDKIPLWLYETPSKTQSLPNGLVIDITEDDDDEDDVTEIIESVSKDESLLCPPFVEELTQEELKLKKINRYIITNIPHLGYFGACQRDSKAIEVFWPNDVKGYRFPNVTFAKNALIQYLSLIFLPVPQDFKINVIIMTHLDLHTNKPVDLKYLTQSGPYICGDFGIYEKNTVPLDFLESHQVSSIDSLVNSNEAIQENVDKMIRLFGLFLMSNEELRKHSEPENILLWATSEIYILKKLGENYESEKADLKNMVRTNSLKLQKLKNQKMSNKASTLTKSAIKITETIEIEDSDEEEKKEKSPKLTNQPVFRKISTSGKIQTGSPVFNKNEARSLLKPKLFVSSGRSLLKINDADKQRFNLVPKQQKNSIEISINNANIILNPGKDVILSNNNKPELLVKSFK